MKLTSPARLRSGEAGKAVGENERTGQHSPVPLDRKITDVISTIEKVSSIYKMKHSKPAADSSQASALTELEKKCREFVELAEKTNKAKASPRLRADAPVFLPSFLRPSSETSSSAIANDREGALAQPAPMYPPPGTTAEGTAAVPVPPPAPATKSTSAAALPKSAVQAVLGGAGSQRAGATPEKAENKPPPPPNKSAQSTPPSKSAAAKAGAIPPPPPSSPTRDEWDEQLRQEVAEATERVWAQAEAWVDAEAEAEEEEWRILEMGINNYVGLTSPSPEFFSTPNGSMSMLPPGLTLLDLSAGRSRTNLTVNTFLDDPILDSPLVSRSDEFRIIRSSARACKSLDGARPLSPFSLTPPYFSSAGALSGRGSLHNKLSSPDRRRTKSPSAALRRLEARLSAAESNRDRNVAAKVQKAMQVTNRVKERMQRAAEKHQQAEEALHDKLKHAELRHVKHINGIRVRAGDENAKVHGVVQLNLANSEAIALTLQQKLEEVEARILAASVRREQRLAGISGSQRKKNSKKALQMSEFKLQLERLKMDRWEKLQQRLEQVQSRREARIAEMKRRVEAEAKRLEALIAEKAAERASERESMTPSRGRPDGTPKTPPATAQSETIPEEQSEELLLPFPASPPRVKASDVVVPTLQILSLQSLQHGFQQFQELHAKAKVKSAFQEAWKTCLEQSSVPTDGTHEGIEALVTHALADKEERASRMYTTILQQFQQSQADTAETINFMVTSAMDSASSGQWDKLQEFSADGGVLLLTALLSREMGALKTLDSVCIFLESSRPHKCVENISRDHIEYGNVLELLRNLLHRQDAVMTQRMLLSGLHVVVADLTLFLLMFASNRSVSTHSMRSTAATAVAVEGEDEKAAGEEDATVRIVHSGLHVNTLLAILADIQLLLVRALLAGRKESDEPCGKYRLLQTMMDCLFPCGHLSLLVQYGQIVVSDLQCDLVALLGSPSSAASAASAAGSVAGPMAPASGGGVSALGSVPPSPGPIAGGGSGGSGGSSSARNPVGSAATPATSFPAQPPAEVMILRGEAARNALQAVAKIATVYGLYVQAQKSCSSASIPGIQARHWLSLFRRNEIFALLCSALALSTEDMTQVVLWPSRNTRSIGSAASMPSSVAEHAQKLQALAMDIVKSMAAVQRAEGEAFQQLNKEQQTRLIIALQEALCFFSTAMFAAKPFPSMSTAASAGVESMAEPPTGREDAVADICAVIGGMCQHNVEARHMIGIVNNTARGPGSNPLASPGQCTLLLTLASLPIRLMKDQRVKNILMPCLIVACLEVENNVNVVRRCGKASYVRKYLEVAVNEWLEWTRDGSSHEEAQSRKDKLSSLMQLLPTDMWEVAQLAWTTGEVKSAKL